MPDYIRPSFVISMRAAVRPLLNAGEDPRAVYWELHSERTRIDEAPTSAEEETVIFPDITDRRERKQRMGALRAAVRKWPENTTNTVYAVMHRIMVNKRLVRTRVYQNFVKETRAAYQELVVQRQRSRQLAIESMIERNAPRVALTEKQREAEIAVVRSRRKRRGGN